jgi:hypothetical protein
MSDDAGEMTGDFYHKVVPLELLDISVYKK